MGCRTSSVSDSYPFPRISPPWLEALLGLAPHKSRGTHVTMWGAESRFLLPLASCELDSLTPASSPSVLPETWFGEISRPKCELKASCCGQDLALWA